MNGADRMLSCGNSAKRTHLLYAMRDKWKAKLLRELLPVPCILCLGYIYGITYPFLALPLWVFFGCLLLYGITPPKVVVWVLCLCCIALGAYAGTSRLAASFALQKQGQAIQDANISPLLLEVMTSSEQAGAMITWVGYEPTRKVGIRVESQEDPHLLPGDLVHITGTFVPLRKNEEDTFDYPLYLAKNGIGARLRANSLKKVRDGPPSIARFVALVRRASLEKMAVLWPGDPGALMAGILIGARGSFSEALSESMRRTGLMHIVAVSGFNMTILISCVLHIGQRLPMWARVLAAILVLLLFTLLVGPSGAVIRACLMGIIALLAKLYARQATAFLCLVYAATVMLIFSPLDAVLDIGFQLSFCAVLGLLWGEPITSKWFTSFPAWFRAELSTTMAAILWTLPLSVVYFSSLSLIAPVANLLVPPSIPYLMLGGFLSFVLAWFPVFDGLTTLLAAAMQIWIEVLLFVSHSLSQLPFAAVHVELATAWRSIFLAGCYGILCLVPYLEWRKGCVGSDA